MASPQNDDLKGAIAIIAFVCFLAASIMVAWHARHYQLIHQPMPNGKGGFMSPSDGYLLATTLFCMSIAALMTAYKIWSRK